MLHITYKHSYYLYLNIEPTKMNLLKRLFSRKYRSSRNRNIENAILKLEDEKPSNSAPRDNLAQITDEISLEKDNNSKSNQEDRQKSINSDPSDHPLNISLRPPQNTFIPSIAPITNFFGNENSSDDVINTIIKELNKIIFEREELKRKLYLKTKSYNLIKKKFNIFLVNKLYRPIKIV